MSRDMSETNYASARQGAIEDELTFVEEQEQLFAVMDEIYETFVISCYLSGKIEADDFWDKKEKYLDHEWIIQPKKWIDPQKEAMATKTALNTGVKTFKQVSAENGTDWRVQIDDMAEVIQYADKRGIDIRGVLFDGKLQDEKEEVPQEAAEAANGGNNAEISPDSGSPENGRPGEGKE
jgi:capsid protein